MMRSLRAGFALPLLAAPGHAAAASAGADFTASGYGLLALLVFIAAYAIVVSEEFLHLRKSKPVVVAAGVIWVLVALAYLSIGDKETAGEALREDLLDYAEMFLFLLAAMTYINMMEERQLFSALRAWLVSRELSFRAVFWITGVLAFFISAVADNLTTALLMGAVALAVGADQPRFVVVACINIVVAANAGGAFSPFGDITTLMVWQKGVLSFWEFFALFVPSLVNWLVPALLMSFAVQRGVPRATDEIVHIRHGGLGVIVLFVVTLTMAVSGHQFLHLPPVLGMMTGLGLLKFYGYYIKRHEQARLREVNGPERQAMSLNENRPFDIYTIVARAEWDTLMFFYGVVLCVGGLGALGYLSLASNTLYLELGPTWANVLVGIISAVVDNIPVMFAVLSMNPDMSDGQWLLVTLAAGVGGSLLSVGSAAGVALMGQARGVYTFFAHLKWTWAIALGYAASVWVHFLVNARLM